MGLWMFCSTGLYLIWLCQWSARLRIYRLAYQLINFSDECLLWGNWCCFKVCSILNVVVLFTLSLGASHSTMISLCCDPDVAQSRSEYQQPARKLSRALWRRDGKRKVILQLCLWNLNSTSNSSVAPCRLSCQISANQREVETSANVNKYWKTHTKDNDVVTNVIFANQHFSSTFWCRYSNSRDVVASSPSFSHPAVRVLRRACSQARVPPSLPASLVDNKSSTFLMFPIKYHIGGDMIAS